MCFLRSGGDVTPCSRLQFDDGIGVDQGLGLEAQARADAPAFGRPSICVLGRSLREFGTVMRKLGNPNLEEIGKRPSFRDRCVD